MSKPTINFYGPLNTLSFGHHTINILEELYKRGRRVNMFLAGPPDISAYNVSKDFARFIESSVNGARRSFSVDDPGLRLWHIETSENRQGRNQHLVTVHELDGLTPHEVNILNQQQTVFASSRYSEEIYKLHDVENVVYCPLAFDATNFRTIERKASDRITFGLFGKFEKRKYTQKVISAWLEKYGRDRNVALNLHITNPHFSPEDNMKLIANACGGYKPFNVNLLPFFPTLKEYNAALNDCDIVIDMSGGEGFSIPSFTATALGKHGVIHNCTAMADWAAGSGAVLVESNGKEAVYDGVFFQQGAQFNQGNLFTWGKEDFIAACETAMNKFRENPVNTEGLTLQDRYTWKKSVDIILSRIDQ